MALLPNECSAVQQDSNNELAEMKDYLHGYSSFTIVEVWAGFLRNSPLVKES